MSSSGIAALYELSKIAADGNNLITVSSSQTKSVLHKKEEDGHPQLRSVMV
ncbi:7860_t:CDS:2 [Paraglomus brasilianum]|uniref:7860_t:CDS:1 n=1 Tax=Paraglomus brasilianum TaxID=144538 RepID=A0A9N9GJD5_9GLOM|nr:7860_t:CDS:2 [Paraglomus brasilianum]